MTGKAPKRAVPSCDTKKTLIRTAQKLIAERGYDNVSIDDITAACGMTKGAFYYSFKSKRDLIYEIERFRFNVLAHDLKASDSTGLDRLEEYIVQWSAFLDAVTRQWLVQNINAEAVGTGSKEGHTAFKDDQNFVMSFLQEAVDAGDLGSSMPICETARSIVLTMYGYAVYRCMYDEQSAAAEWGRSFAKRTVDSLLAFYPAPDKA